VVKGIWAYIKENNLQNPANKSEIVPDSKLKVGLNSEEVIGLPIHETSLDTGPGSKPLNPTPHEHKPLNPSTLSPQPSTFNPQL
jgi:chromatin remodeling complex protein RSC6